jgi:hypothetical protein
MVGTLRRANIASASNYPHDHPRSKCPHLGLNRIFHDSKTLENGKAIIKDGNGFKALPAIYCPDLIYCDEGGSFLLPKFNIDIGSDVIPLPEFKNRCLWERTWIDEDDEYDKAIKVLGLISKPRKIHKRRHSVPIIQFSHKQTNETNDSNLNSRNEANPNEETKEQPVPEEQKSSNAKAKRGTKATKRHTRRKSNRLVSKDEATKTDGSKTQATKVSRKRKYNEMENDN